MERRLAEPTFADAFVADLGSVKLAGFFADMQAFVPWDELARRCANVFDDSTPAQGGRPHWPVMVLLKCQFLQTCFNLSDPALEEAINDRLSFRRFLGLSLEESAPDETTMVRFRERMVAGGHGSTVFDTIKARLEERGLILKQGTIVDATLIEKGRGHWSRASTDAADLHTRDKSVTATRHNGRTSIGHKASIATDTRGTIKDFVYDTASTHESNHFDQLTEQETTAVYADKAYWSYDRMDKLSARGVFPGIGLKRLRGQGELTRLQKQHNKRVARVRYFVEHPLALLKKLGLRRLIYRGLRKNAFRFAWAASVVNLKRCLDPWKASLVLNP